MKSIFLGWVATPYLSTLSLIAFAFVGCGESPLPDANPKESEQSAPIEALLPRWVPIDLVTTPPDEAPDAEAPCPDSMVCVNAFPFQTEATTANATRREFDRYGCDASTNESGPEIIYRVTLERGGFLSAAIYDEAGVDIDVHILSALDADACLARGHHHAAADVAAGVYYIVADTYVSSNQEFAGDYQLHIGFTAPSVGPCSMESGIMPRVGDGEDHLEMPATGMMVMEAHLVTQQEPAPYPASSRDELQAHYELSQSRTGFVMHRRQTWAPLEGGNFYGCGIGSPSLFPLEHESWYVNMYWRSAHRPARGTRMILRRPDSNIAVVVAAGYETGPGNLSRIGGTTEETHFYLGTGHLSQLQLGIAEDQSLPFGPRLCSDNTEGDANAP